MLKDSSPKKETILKILILSPFKIDEFVSSEQIWRNVALHHLFTNVSSAVNGCRQNESPNSW